ncbi:MAG TPA: DUF3570 domain-containing protein [Myxococcales bacterium]|nr:DUF3570 domain-containing protein [Myxococcales bacterium]
MTSRKLNNRKARRAASRGRKRTILASLTSAAVALLGPVTSSHAGGPVEKFGVAYAFSDYREDNIKKSKFSGLGERSRYKIDTHQFSLEGPVLDRADIGFDFIYESMSGATPWFVQPENTLDSTSKPVQAMSGATVTEKRYDGSVSGNYYFDSARAGAHVGVSKEKDYLAVFAGINGEYHLNEKNTTVTGGFAFSIDEIKPTEGGTDGRIVKDDKQSINLNAGVSQILNRETVAQLSLTYKHSRGFLSDPYKKAFVLQLGGITISDSRPDERNQVSVLAQLRRHFESTSASVHANYRFHADDWDITSHTFELRWVQNLYDDLIQLTPHFRYYSQSQADFYEPFYITERSDGLASSDYRLAPYGSFVFGASLGFRLERWPFWFDWRIAANYERHIADADFALVNVKVKNPGLVNYHFTYVTLEAKF